MSDTTTWEEMTVSDAVLDAIKKMAENAEPVGSLSSLAGMKIKSSRYIPDGLVSLVGRDTIAVMRLDTGEITVIGRRNIYEPWPIQHEIDTEPHFVYHWRFK